MLIKFHRLTLHNFKSHHDLSVEFGDLTKITGDNEKGKSSILEAVSWLLYGTDLLGGKLDPSPTTYEFDEVKAELLFSVDEKQVLLGRGIAKGKNQFWINEVPSKATDFNSLVDSLFDRELFLSLFNPNYFFTMHWEKQREMLLRYVSPPANKEVFKELPRPQADKLAELVKKHSLDDLDKIHRTNKTKLEKEHIAAKSRTKTLEEQLAQLQQPAGDLLQLQQERDKLEMHIREIEKRTSSANENNQKINSLQAQINALQERIRDSAAKWPELKNEPIEDVCRTCKQPLDETALNEVKADKERRMEEYRARHKQMVAKRKELEAELAQLEYIDLSDQLEKIRVYQEQLIPILDSIRIHQEGTKLKEQVEQAKKDEEDKLKSLNESIFIIDAIKAFRAKEAELQAEKVQGLFTTLSIRLYEQLKNGELKNTFEIERDTVPYRRLSRSGKVRAGLELREVLSEQSGIVAPVAVDDSESVFRIKKPSGQLILVKAVEGKELTIESEGVTT